MNLLLDTCAFICFQAASDVLSRTARAAIPDSRNEVYMSAGSAWEIGRKYASGALVLNASPDLLIPRVREESGIESLPLMESDALMAEKLPRLHRDPFDRILIAQALVNGMKIVTPDEAFHAYPVHLIGDRHGYGPQGVTTATPSTGGPAAHEFDWIHGNFIPAVAWDTEEGKSR